MLRTAKNNILINEQHGFRNKLSTITQLINTTTDWADTHKFILSKLRCYGIRNRTLSWIGAFLSNRTQTTVANGVHSSYVDDTSGVPQGSVIGPILFPLYINDINNAITSQIKLIDDDSVLYINIHIQNDHLFLKMFYTQSLHGLKMANEAKY